MINNNLAFKGKKISSKRIYHHPKWYKDGLPIIYVTHEEYDLIHRMEEERISLRKHQILLGRQNGKFSPPALFQLISLYQKYKKHFHFIKAWKLKKNLKIYEIYLK